jgi:hypothetical protein
MIRNDAELQATQERILLFERILAEARRTYSPSNYPAMAEGYLLEIDKLQAEIRAYLSYVPDPIERARNPSV